MRTRWKIAALVIAVVTLAIGVVVIYRQRTAGHDEVRIITERVAAAMAVGDRAALVAEPHLIGRTDTVDWLMARGPLLTSGYQVYVQRNGANGYQLLDLQTISHVGVIETPAGKVSLGFWRDPEGGGLKFVTAASSHWVSPSRKATGGEIRLGGSNTEQ